MAADKAQVSTLFRRLLVRVHPDVVAAQSDRFRSHNEATLKVLLACMDDDNKAAPASSKINPKIHFYLRDGGKTATVQFNRNNPLHSLQALLGEVPPTQQQEAAKSPDAKQKEDPALRREETRRIWEHTLNDWWNNRVRNVDNMELLFQQNRVKFVPDYLDWKAPVDTKFQHKFAIESALGLVNTAFDFHVKDTTLDAMVQAPELQKIELRIVGKNLYKPSIWDKTVLCVPLGCPPELLGKEIDKLVDKLVKEICEAQQLKEVT